MKKGLLLFFCIGLIASLIQISPVAATTNVSGYNHLNNGYIQFSDFGGTQPFDWTNLSIDVLGSAVNASGNLNHPYYFDGTAWRPLTLYRKMEYALSEGGTLDSSTDPYQVSGAGPIVYPVTNEQVLTNFSIDGTGITKKDLPTTAGSSTYTGTLISKGEVLVNGKNLEIKNTYTLLEGKSFIRVKTIITNLDTTQTATNIRYWVGTGDDWIGLDDTNYKTRGNIIDGAFVQISASAEQSKAIRVDSRSLNESILFYSTHPNANTSVAYCCSFSNAVGTNPKNSSINVLSDGSYALFVNLGSINPGESKDFDWYYAAGSAATIIDTINDVGLDSSGASQITWSSATVKYSSPTLTTGYYMVLPRGSTAPTVDQLLGDAVYDSASITKQGVVSMEAGVETSIEITDLSPISPYDVYFVTKNLEGDTSIISKTSFTTLPLTLISLTHFDSVDIPMNHRIPDSGTIDTVEYTATVEWTPDVERFIAGQTYSATITVLPKAGYTLTGIGVNAFTVTGASSVTNDADSGIITVNYPEVTYDKVNFHSNGGTTVDSQGVNYGDLVTKPIDPVLSNYDFIGWFKDDGVFEDAWNFDTDIMAEGDLNLYAKWVLTTYQITYELDGGVNYLDALNTYTFESPSISLHKPTRSGHIFLGWYQNADKETGGIITSIPQGSSGNITLYAKWMPIPVIIEADDNLGIKSSGMAEGVPFTADELEKEISVQLVITIQELTDLDVGTKTILDEFIAQNIDDVLQNLFLLDISLFKWVDDEKVSITSTSNMTRVTFIVPEIFRNKEYMLVRIHDGVAEELQYTYNPDTFELSFETDRFSSYSLVSWATSLPDAGVNSNNRSILLLVIGVFLLLVSRNKKQTI